MQPSLTHPLPPDQRSSNQTRSTQSHIHQPYQDRIYDDLLSELHDCRQKTLALVNGITPTLLSKQAHPDFSPIGWHLGHIAYTEALWIVKEAQISDRYQTLFAADGLPKAERQNLPPLTELLDYLQTVRSQAMQQIEQAQPRLLFWLLQHEGQHAETMAMVMAMHERSYEGKVRSLLTHLPDHAASIDREQDDHEREDMVFIKGGAFQQGTGAPWAIDNEMPSSRTRVNSFYIDRYPVTCAQFAQFIAAGGYRTREWWSAKGWAWLQQTQVQAPFYWSEDSAIADKPVCGVSWYEAAAYARSLRKRLPTESEWEKAATDEQCEGMLGGVWEWTNTWFDGYAGFQPFPYAGYSQTYFDGEHRVLKGGSWASPKSIVRKSFRNWYHPHRRELFAGFRCAL